MRGWEKTGGNVENGDIIMLIIKISHNFPLEHFIFIHVIINFCGFLNNNYFSLITITFLGHGFQSF